VIKAKVPCCAISLGSLSSVQRSPRQPHVLPHGAPEASNMISKTSTFMLTHESALSLRSFFWWPFLMGYSNSLHLSGHPSSPFPLIGNTGGRRSLKVWLHSPLHTVQQKTKYRPPRSTMVKEAGATPKVHISKNIKSIKLKKYPPKKKTNR